MIDLDLLTGLLPNSCEFKMYLFQANLHREQQENSCYYLKKIKTASLRYLRF